MRKLFFLFYLVFFVTAVTLVSCDEDEETEYLVINGLMAGEINLISSSNTLNVPLDPSIEAEFSHPLNPSTVGDSSITLTRIYDNLKVPLNYSVNGSIVTITPKEDLDKGTKYTIRFDNDIVSTGGLTMTPSSRTFTTTGTFSPEGIVSYFAMEGNAADSLGTHDPTNNDIQDISFVGSKNRASGLAAHFNGTSSIIEIPNADAYLEGDDITIGFWMKAEGDQQGSFVLGLAGSKGFYFEVAEDFQSIVMVMSHELSSGEAISVENRYTGTEEMNTGWTLNKNVSSSGGVGNTYFNGLWAHVVFTYSSATNLSSIYLNGELVKQQDYDLYAEGAPERMITGLQYDGNVAPGNELALGFLQARENSVDGDPVFSASDMLYNGLLDDIKIFSSVLTAAQVRRLYNSEVPQ